MPPSPRSFVVVALFALAACGKHKVVGGTAGTGGGADGSAGVGGELMDAADSRGSAGADASATDSSVAGADARDACAPDLKPTSGPPPGEIGCYVGTNCGWEKVLCNCELPATNPSTAAANVTFTLDVTPATVTPSLTATPQVQATFDDADESWFTAWSAQTGAGTSFAVTKAAGKTIVRLAAPTLKLASVSLPASTTRNVRGFVNGAPKGTTLNLDSTIAAPDGGVLATGHNVCVEVHPSMPP